MTDYWVLTADPHHARMQHASADPTRSEVDYLRFGYRLKRPGLDLSTVPEFFFVVPSGSALDWTRSVESVPLLSDRLRHALDALASPQDEVVWFPASLDEGGVDRQFWVPYFPSRVDGLNESSTTRGPGGPIRWVVDPVKLEGRDVMAIAETGSRVIVVSDRVRRALIDAGVLEGVCVDPARV